MLFSEADDASPVPQKAHSDLAQPPPRLSPLGQLFGFFDINKLATA